MLEFWTELPWWLRLLVALLILGVGVVVFLFASVRAGCVIAGAGLVMFAIGGRSQSEKNGYRF